MFKEDRQAAKEMQKQKSQWQEGQYVELLRDNLAAYFEKGREEFTLYNSGRAALFIALQACGIGSGDEVLLQAFTCNAVPNPILWTGAKPVYVDVEEETYNMDVMDAEKKITPSTKAIIVQHTFGKPANLEQINALAKKHNLFVIEDCAHALGATLGSKKLGTLGDIAFFSFGRDKVISSVYGGALLANNKELEGKVRTLHTLLRYPDNKWIAQQLRHPLLMNWILKVYNIPFSNYGVGKVTLQALQASRVFSKAVHWKEKRGAKPEYFPKRLPSALAYLALTQFKRLDKFNAHRRQLAKLYHNGLLKTKNVLSSEARVLRRQNLKTVENGHIYLRYPLQHKKAHNIIQALRKRGILVGDWYDSPVAPADSDLKAMGYREGTCPVAERLATQTFNLPTNPTLSIKQAEQLVNIVADML